MLGRIVLIGASTPWIFSKVVVAICKGEIKGVAMWTNSWQNCFRAVCMGELAWGCNVCVRGNADASGLGVFSGLSMLNSVFMWYFIGLAIVS